jgi:hypothetical protein
MLAMVAVSALGAPACEPGTVTLAFRPEAGQELDYDTSVESTTTTDVPCHGPATTRSDRTRLDSHQRILDVGDDGVLVEVALTRPRLGTRTFTVRFDRAAQLTAVEQVEGIPAVALGGLGLSEIFPAAAGAPPEEPLAPGDRWTIDDEVVLPGQTDPTRLTGDGHLVELGVEDGHDVATVDTTTVLPVQTRTEATSGTQTLQGTQTTRVVATYDLEDGTLRRARAVTTEAFALTLGPPPGGGGDPCSGRLAVEVRSEVRRVER